MALDNAYPTPASTLTTMAQWETLLAQVGSGIIQGIGAEFTPSLNSASRQAIIGTGAALMRGFVTNGATSTATTAPAASASPRIDRLVLRLDRTAVTAAGWVNPVIIPGTPAVSPSPPAISFSLTGSWDLPICQYRANPDGSLSGLIDERYWLSGPVARIVSTSRPPTPYPRLAFETDTGRLVWADGTNWRVLVDASTADQGVSIPSGWAAVAANLAQSVSGVVDVDITLKRTSFMGQSDVNANGAKLCTVPAGLQPRRTKYFAAVMNGPKFGRVQVQTDGAVWLFHVSGDMATNDVLYLTMSYIK